jgi:hypothetical protein
MINKLSGTFSVVDIKKSTTRKGFSQLKEHDVFKIEMPVGKAWSKRVNLDLIINGTNYPYTLNEINLVFKQILTVQQIN